MTDTNSNWTSTVDAEEVFREINSLTFPSVVGDSVLALKAQNSKEAHNALVLCSQGGNDILLSPPSMDVLTKINGYGGKPYWLDRNDEHSVYFSNGKDQQIYRSNISNELDQKCKVERVSPNEKNANTSNYVDLNIVSSTFALAIVEQSVNEITPEVDKEPQTIIASFNLKNRQSPLQALVSGHDFYSNLVINLAQDKAAWVAWDHPNMPWNDTEIWTADIVSNQDGLSLINQTQLFRDRAACYCQLVFSNDNQLFFVADFTNRKNTSEDYWNVYSYDPKNDKTDFGQAIQVTALDREFAGPHWRYGDHRIVAFDDENIAAIGMHREGSNLYLINTKSLVSLPVLSNSPTLQMMASDGKGKACFIHGSRFEAESIAEYSQDNSLTVWPNKSPYLEREAISTAKHLQFKTSNKETAYGYFYSPNKNTQSTQNPQAQNQRKPDQPPLVVIVHGGPTARAYNQYDPLKQFWTSRGFALFDVNHRGSTGYGRAYRDSLYGHWGDKDALDIKHGVQHLIDAKLVDPNKVFIRGRSAGGFAVLRALTEYPELFCAGASYFGIGNLITLASSTHKFEKYYVDLLLQETFSSTTSNRPSSKFFTNSPINYIKRLASPMILFQGENDKVVPPQVSHEVVDVLKANAIEHEYVEFEGEGHGFRSRENNVNALNKELAFYNHIMNRNDN